jgi:hypothetical protein
MSSRFHEGLAAALVAAGRRLSGGPGGPGAKEKAGSRAAAAADEPATCSVIRS